MTDAPPNEENLVARPLWRDITIAGLALLLATLGVLAVLALRHVLGVLFLGVVVGITLSPVADRLARYHVPRVLSVLLVYGLVLAALGGFGWYAFTSLSSEVQRVNDLEGSYAEVARRFNLPTAEELKSFVSSHSAGLLGTVETGVVRTLTALADMVAIFLVSILFAISKDRIRDTTLAVTPPRHRTATADMLELLAHRLRLAVLGLFLAMLSVGVLVYVGLRLLGMPFPLVLAAIAFLTEILPYIGPWLGYIPALLVALTQGWLMAVKVSALYLGVQEFEAHVIVPFVHSRVNSVPALLIVVGILVGVSLMGVLGALVALPVVVILYALFFEWFVPWRRRQFGEPPAPAPPDC